jgi:hypothetical protein
VKRKGVDENTIKDIKHTSLNIPDLISKLNKYTLQTLLPDGNTVKDIENLTIKKFGITLLLGKYWVLSSDNNKHAYDDNNNVKNVIYYIKKQNVDNFDVIGIYLKRNFINSSGDNLTKRISTVQITALYDLRKFLFGLYCAKVLKEGDSYNAESETEVTTPPSVEVPNIGKDEEGNVTNNGPTNSEATGGEYETKTEVTVETQQTVFRIKVDISETDKINWNQQFYSIEETEGGGLSYSVDGLSAVFAVGNRFTDEVYISTELEGTSTLCIDFNVIWNGDLQEKKLDKENGIAHLFIKMPNKLIYRLDFLLKDFKKPEITNCDE